MSILTVSAISDVAHRAAERTSIADNRLNRVLAVLLVFGFSGLAGVLALVTMLYLVGGAILPGLFVAALTVVAGAPAVVIYSWLDQSESKTLF
jgi:hypothetical protein